MAVLCVNFQSAWTTEMCVMKEQALTIFEFGMRRYIKYYNGFPHTLRTFVLCGLLQVVSLMAFMVVYLLYRTVVCNNEVNWMDFWK